MNCLSTFQVTVNSGCLALVDVSARLVVISAVLVLKHLC